MQLLGCRKFLLQIGLFSLLPPTREEKQNLIVLRLAEPTKALTLCAYNLNSDAKTSKKSVLTLKELFEEWTKMNIGSVFLGLRWITWSLGVVFAYRRLACTDSTKHLKIKRLDS